MSGKTALLLGASGETGKEVLNYLVKTDVFTKIVCVVRRNKIRDLFKVKLYTIRSETK